MPSIPDLLSYQSHFTAAAILLWVISIAFYAWFSRKEDLAIAERREYSASGLSHSRVDLLGSALMELPLSDSQKTWISASLLSEIHHQIDLCIRCRDRSLLYLKISRLIPLFTGLLTAAAGQLSADYKNMTLFAVNILMVGAGVAIELSRADRFGVLWLNARSTSNRIFSESTRYLSGSLRSPVGSFDHADEFTKWVDRVETILQDADDRVNAIISLDLEAPPDKSNEESKEN